jgi:hypothetical protein
MDRHAHTHKLSLRVCTERRCKAKEVAGSKPTDVGSELAVTTAEVTLGAALDGVGCAACGIAAVERALHVHSHALFASLSS